MCNFIHIAKPTAALMRMRPISTRVNEPANDDSRRSVRNQIGRFGQAAARAVFFRFLGQPNRPIRTPLAGRLRLHAPVFVATPRDGSFITPYFFDYGGRSAYNSPGLVYHHLDGAGPQSSCRLWRYNYLYWVC